MTPSSCPLFGQYCAMWSLCAKSKTVAYPTLATTSTSFVLPKRDNSNFLLRMMSQGGLLTKSDLFLVLQLCQMFIIVIISSKKFHSIVIVFLNKNFLRQIVENIAWGL